MNVNKFFDQLKKILLYGGIEKEQFKMISSEIDKSNRKSIIILSSACLIVYALRLCLSYSAVPDINRIIFLNAILLFGILAVGNLLVSDHHCFVHISAYLFMAFYLGVGILSAVGAGSIHERTTLYLVFVVVAPMLYALNAIELSMVIIPAEVIYLILITKFQSAYPVYITNFGNSLFFSISGLLLGIYMANMKISGIYNTYTNAHANKIKDLTKQLAFSRQELETALSDNRQLQQLLPTLLNHMIKLTSFDDNIRFRLCQKNTSTSGSTDYELRIKSDKICKKDLTAFTKNMIALTNGTLCVNIKEDIDHEFIISLHFAM